jgi:lysophospholipase L1-like esterase
MGFPDPGDFLDEALNVLRVAAFGDSLMWGQGIARGKEFKSLVVRVVGKGHGRLARMVYDRSRSGAQIILRDGNEREVFVDRYPQFFKDDESERRLTELGDESVASKLFGEIPSSLPSISKQVELIDREVGASVNVALVAGGANDLNFEDIVNPSVHTDGFIENFHGSIRQVCHDDMATLIRAIREKCPRAVILVFGYFPALSYESAPAKIREYFKYELNSTVKWYLNELLNIEDVDRLVYQARVRAVWAHGWSTYWLRRAVLEANRDSAVRGPGIVFVPSGFRAVNAAFASRPFVHEDYRAPVTDSMEVLRRQNLPRHDAITDLARMFLQLLASDNYKGAKALRGKINGPRSLEQALFTRSEVGGKSPKTLLNEELHRLQRALIASFFHPNEWGAARYADLAESRYVRHRKTMDALPKLPVDDTAVVQIGESLGERLTRFGLRGPGPIQADVGNQFVDAVRVITETANDSDRNLGSDVYISFTLLPKAGQPRTVSWQLNFQYREIRAPIVDARFLDRFYPQFDPGRKDDFAIDTGGSVEIADIVGCRIRLSPPRPGTWKGVGNTWRPKTITLDINGVTVAERTFAGKSFGPGDTIDFDYPEPASDPGAPEVVSHVFKA